MGETFLDRHGIKSGIKLNDVIEENRYVANGKTVKKGDFLTYVGDDVAPAIEPPFNAIALSSGVGAPEFIEAEVTKTGNIFPLANWTSQVEYTKFTKDGYTLEASSQYSDAQAHGVNTVCDGVEDMGTTYWKSAQAINSWVKMTLPEATKITKMKTHVRNHAGADYFVNAIIQGSNDDVEWDNLYTITEMQTEFTEITLNKTGFYKYYRIYITLTTTTQAFVCEWQTSEYIVKEQIPSTEHNEQVKIARVYKEVEVEKAFTGNIIPTSWTKVSDTEYVSANGTRVTSSSRYSTETLPEIFDGDTTTYCRLGSSTNNWVKLEFPEAVCVTIMYVSVDLSGSNHGFYLQASEDDLTWTTLHTEDGDYVGNIATNLSSSQKYKFYRLKSYSSADIIFTPNEWQTVEYIEKVTEVIQ